MKSWADHCSSDEEDEDIPRVQVPPQVEESDSESEYSDNEEEENNNNNRGNNSGPRNNNYNRDRNPRPPPVLPTSAPFTAFVGNLSYEIQDAKHLAYELERLCQEKLQRSVTAVDGRLMTDRESGMKKGYGYIEFDTVEDLATVLELSGNVELYNRVLRIDVANAPKNQNNNRRNSNHNNQQNHHHNQRGPPHYNNNNNYNRSASNLSQASGTSEIDGSNFRGGKYNRQNSSHSTSNNDGPDKTESGGGDTVQRTRPKLNLMARTKPLEIRQDSTTSNSSIFGSGKARAEQTESGAGKDTSPASPSVTILKRENKDSSEQKSTAAPSATGESDDVKKEAVSNNTNKERSGSFAQSDRNNNKRRDSRHNNKGDGNNRRISGRGGGDRRDNRGGRGRGDQRKRSDKNNSNNQRGGKRAPQQQKDGWDEPTGGKVSRSFTETSAPPTIEATKSKKDAPVNKFALLGIDSDSD